MNEHAFKIWDAWMNGCTVQFDRGNGQGIWQDVNPKRILYANQPQHKPELWRIKPATESKITITMANSRDEVEVEFSETISQGDAYHMIEYAKSEIFQRVKAVGLEVKEE